MANKFKTGKAKIKIDLSDWDSGCWPDYLEKCFKFEVDDEFKSVEITLDQDALDKAAKTIAGEAIASFFNDETVYFYLTDAGLEIGSSEMSPTIIGTAVIPMKYIWFRSKRDWKKDLAIWREHLDKEAATMRDDGDDTLTPR